ncbi:MAG: hypothetical protein ABIJ46_02950 [bacterium]
MGQQEKKEGPTSAELFGYRFDPFTKKDLGLETVERACIGRDRGKTGRLTVTVNRSTADRLDTVGEVELGEFYICAPIASFGTKPEPVTVVTVVWLRPGIGSKLSLLRNADLLGYQYDPLASEVLGSETVEVSWLGCRSDGSLGPVVITVNASTPERVRRNPDAQPLAAKVPAAPYGIYALGLPK